MKPSAIIALAYAMIIFAHSGATSSALADEVSPYMGGPVELVKAPNGAITNKAILDGIEKVAWLKPTIEQPVEGIWVFGGYGLAPIAIIDTDSI